MGRDISSVSASQNIKVMKYFSQYWQHDDCQNEDFFSSHCIRFYINKDLFFYFKFPNIIIHFTLSANNGLFYFFYI